MRANRLTRSPNLVWKRMLMKTDPKTEGINTMPNIAALATMRHFSNAETVCDNNASNSTQTTPAITIALASHKLSLNHAKPSRYDWKRNISSCGIQVMNDNRINNTDIFPTTYSVRVNGRQR